MPTEPSLAFFLKFQFVISVTAGSVAVRQNWGGEIGLIVGKVGYHVGVFSIDDFRFSIALENRHLGGEVRSRGWIVLLPTKERVSQKEENFHR